MAGMRWRFGAYELDLARRELRIAGEPRQLQPQVFAVLAFLVRNRHRVVPKEEILRELWPDAVVTDASLQRAVSLARRALRPADRGLLRTHARQGYRFTGELAEDEQDPAEAAADAPPRYVRSADVHVAYRTVGRGPLDVVLVLGWSLGMRTALEL